MNPDGFGYWTLVRVARCLKARAAARKGRGAHTPPGLMFFTDPVEDGPEVQSGALSTAMIGLTAFVTLALGAVPQPVLDLANHAGQFLR